MACLGECWDLGPPPDSILYLPPPPAPYFVQSPLSDLLNSTPCSATQLCESLSPSNRIPDSGDYIDLPRKEVETWSVSSIDDTWLLVLVASSIGVLLLGALLAMFLLKCREMNMFGSNECSMHTRDHLRQIKHHEQRECTSVNNINSNNKLVHPSETVLYHGNGLQDNRMVWAALTPRGTQHFVSENYPRDLVDYVENEDHYETIDNIHSVIPHHHPRLHQQEQQEQQQLPLQPYHTTYNNTYNNTNKGLITNALAKSSFDNSGFVDYDYEDPTPLIESYQMNDIDNQRDTIHHYSTMMMMGGGGGGGNTDMRCASLGLMTGGSNTLRRGVPPPLGVTLRPRVSPPTRIEHPNLPPLNLYPHNKTNTLRKNTLNYRIPDTTTATLPKYGC